MEDDARGRRKAVPASSSIRFGPYELDLRSAELLKNDLRIRLQEQPFRILIALLKRPGEVVPREEIRKKLWPDDTVVEFDHGINAAVKRLRDALCDSAEKPRYIETLARKGYRFIGQIEGAASEPTESSSNGGDPVPSIGLDGSRASHEHLLTIQPFVEAHQPDMASIEAGQPIPRARLRNRLIVLSALAVAALAVGSAITFRLQLRAKSEPKMTRLTFDSGLTTEPTLSPDGKLLAYASDRNGSGHLHLWVQQFIPEGPAVQLTNGDADEHQPTFSPDGSRIVFRSERDGGGIYVIPAIGGDAVLLAKGGRDPRFSPDGQRIAYWQADMMSAPWLVGYGTVHLVSSAGGASQPVISDLKGAGVPQWSDDGKYLIVFGRKVDTPPAGTFDWWVMPAGGGPATPTHALVLLRNQGFRGADWEAPRVANWRGDELLFCGRYGDSTNVWKVHIDVPTFQVTGGARRLTSGTGLDAYPSLITNGHLVFASLTNSSDVWMLAVDTDHTNAIGQPQRVTEAIGPHHFASLSIDGKLLAYSSIRYERPRAWIKNFENGTTTPVSSGAGSQRVAQISPDGSLIVYTTGGENGAGFVMPVHGGTADQFCQDCATAYDLSPDNQIVLYRKGSDIRAFNLISRRESLFMEGARYPVYQHKFSPDGRWVAFETVHGSKRSQLFIAAINANGVPEPDSEWIPVTDDVGWADKPRWSPNGSVIYFLSNRDGFFCLWAQRVSPDSKRPAGPPLPVSHFHSSRLAVGNVGSGGAIEISVARDKIALNLGELSGNIWATQLSH